MANIYENIFLYKMFIDYKNPKKATKKIDTQLLHKETLKESLEII